MESQVRIALVGNYRPKAIPIALPLATAHLDPDIHSHMLPTEFITSTSALQNHDAAQPAMKGHLRRFTTRASSKNHSSVSAVA